MTLDFKDIQISVSGQPIMAESVNLTWETPNIPVYSLGYQNCIGYVRESPPTTNLSINYIIEIGNDPLFTGTNDLILNRPTGSISAFPIVVANLSGEYYPNSYSFEISEEQDVIIAQIQLTSFKGISGYLSSGEKLDYNKSNGSNVAHSSTSYGYSNNRQMTEYNILNFNYNVSFDIEPIYIMGSPYPVCVLCNGGTIDANLNTLSLNAPNFSGQTLTQYFGFRTFDIILAPISSIYQDDYLTQEITQLYDAYISNAEISIQNNGYINSNITIQKNF